MQSKKYMHFLDLYEMTEPPLAEIDPQSLGLDLDYINVPVCTCRLYWDKQMPAKGTQCPTLIADS